MYSHKTIEKAKSWAMSTNSLRVYPQCTVNTYTYRGVGANGKSKTKTKSYVNLVIETGNARHVGKHEYEQGQQMTDKVNEIYVHYYLKANPDENN